MSEFLDQMTPERWRRVQELFAAATERDASVRSAFLDEACRDDAELRAEVESLLSSLGTVSPSFLESPAIEVEGVTAIPVVDGAGRRALGKGTRLGPYEILSPLGSGGMGEVYRARDERLGREVAIKVLSGEVAADSQRLRRFEKEARSASALNHPNIVTIHDIGTSGGVSYIAMEKVEGETLRALVNGPLTMKRFLQIAPQIADGLARAHEAGIVHRDLKPENVMVTRDGLVKILDFGLAKLTSTGSGSDEGSRLPTMSGTTPGVVVGTVGYMSPEQANGEKVDYRSDQFSFGSMLYEMATGKRAFQKKTAIDTLGAILNEEPEPIATLNPKVPAPLRWIVERCLAKDPRQRYSSTDDLGRDLAKLRDHLSEATSGVALSSTSRRRRAVSALVVGAAALALVIVAVGLLRRPTPAPRQAVRFAIAPPPNTSIAGGFHCFAFSPDGSQLAFRAGGEPARIWLRPLAAAEARPVPGTENVDSLFWSPDNRSIGYFAAGKLWRVDVSGGAPIPVCDVNARHMYVGSWGSGGQILFARFPGDAIYRVSTSEGRPAAIVKPDKARGEMTVAWPWFLPDGRSFLYLSQDAKGGSLMLSSLGGPSRRLLPLLSRAEYIEPGYLVFVREGTLFAQRFDSRRGTISGEPSSIAEAVRYSQRDGFGAFATSLSGAIASATFWRTPRYRIGWFDRTGRAVDRLEALAPLALPGEANDVAIDPAGRRVLFDRTDPRTRIHHLWILDLGTKTEVRVTSDETDERSARWLPDGRSIVFTAGTGGMVQLRRRDLSTGRVEPLLPYGEDQQGGAVVGGGTQLLYETVTEEGNAETRFVDLSGNHETTALPHATAFDEAGGFSPDGRLILLASNASGRDEIYVASSASPTERIPVSSGGAIHGVAVWSRDGSEVFYLSPERQLISVPIHEKPSLAVGKPSVLFTTSADAAWNSFDVSPDGKTFLAVYSEGVLESVPLNVVLNWTAAIEQGTPAR